MNTSATTVVVHCGELDGGHLERRLREVVAATPPHARVVATVLGRRRTSPRIAQRVELVVVRDGGAALLEAEVARDAHLLVVPPLARMSTGWCEDALRRVAEQPLEVGVLRVGSQHFFAYPATVTRLDAPRTAWAAVRGLTTTSGAPRVRRGPSLGAVLIVKDEELRLGSCLAALKDVVDELVVYDTGSTDATPDIARAAGATVVEGFWDDDFSSARNRALAHATTEWVLSVDADEVLMGDRHEVRRWLQRADGDLALVRVVSPSTSATQDGDDVRAYRLFRRAGARWAGALHEQVVAVDGAPRWTPCSEAPPLQLLHSGYALGHERVAEKAQRNLTVARAAREALPEHDPQWPEATVAFARALGQAGQHDECIEVLRTVADREVTPGNVVQAARGVIPLLLQRGLLDEAEAWSERAAGSGESPGLTSLRRAMLRYGRGETVGAIEDLERLVRAGGAAGGTDLWGREFDNDAAAVAAADLRLGIGQAYAAATGIVQVMVRSPHKVPMSTLLRAVLAAGGDLHELASYTPEALVERSLKEAPVTVPDLALAWASALADTHPDDPRPLVAGSVLAARTSVEVSLEWSVRAREAGLDQVCALRWLAEDGEAHARVKALAWAILVHGLGQANDSENLDTAVDLLGTQDADDVLDTLRRLVPGVVSLRSAPRATVPA